jgi:drug/metabolite transporter (DMT)-like permease
MAPDRYAPSWLVWLNLLVVYVVWGSTYLAIRIAVETLPPFLSAGVRFGFAGGIVLLALGLSGGFERLRIGVRELAATALVGALLLVFGNGFVMLAERDVASGLAALIIASVPLWVVVLRLVHGERPSRVAIGGVAVLVVPQGGASVAVLVGALLLVVASVSWATGSYYSRRLPLPRDLYVSSGYQQLAGGLLLVVAGIAVGEPARFDPSAVRTESVVALAYLAVFGSLVAFTSYSWLLQHAPISRVATYAYVNPVVAVALGWLVLNESITPTLLAGAAIVVAAVVIITRSERPKETSPAAIAASREPPSEAVRPSAPAERPAVAADSRRG